MTSTASISLHPEYAGVPASLLPSPTVAALLDAWQAQHAHDALSPAATA